MMLREMREGRGPIYMDTKTALLTTFATLTEEQQKDLESEAWEDFLDMCVGQANLWAATNTAPEAVSYTHLDVYKRQATPWPNWREPTPPA